MSVLFTTLFVLALAGAQTDDIEYRPGGPALSHTWDQFYTKESHEPELMDPLISAGRKVTPAVCEAVRHKDMMYRRYALGALGFIGDRRALSTLAMIINDDSERDWFRGDALQALFNIDKALGRRYAEQYYTTGPDYLKGIAGAVKRNERWLRERPREQ